MPTLRNVDKRPYPSFVKAYGHNGYFKNLKSIVHFYNTRDVLRRCGPNDPGDSDEEENALVSFMQTLTDGFMQR